jgi:hypothetical protein
MINLEKLRTDFFLSMSGMSLLSAFSTITCIIQIVINWIKAIMKNKTVHTGCLFSVILVRLRVEAYWNSVRVLLPDPVSLRLPLLCNTKHERSWVQFNLINTKG